MAFEMEYKWRGFTYSESYWRITQYSFNKITGKWIFEIACYPNKAARQESSSNIIGSARVYHADSPMTEAECYEYAKQLADIDAGEQWVSFFSTATDV